MPRADLGARALRWLTSRVFAGVRCPQFGKLPALVDTKGGDKYIEGSNMCMQVIASRADAAGKGQGGNKYCGTPTEFPYVGAIAALVNQFEVEMNLVSLAAGAPANAAEVIQKYYTSIDAELRATDDDDVRTEKYLTGKNLTYADITAFAVINGVAEIHGLKSVRVARWLEPAATACCVCRLPSSCPPVECAIHLRVNSPLYRAARGARRSALGALLDWWVVASRRLTDRSVPRPRLPSPLQLRQFPKLKEFHDRLGGRPRIEARITSRAPLELGN